MILPETVTNYPDLFSIMEAFISNTKTTVLLSLSRNEFYDLQRILESLAGSGPGYSSFTPTDCPNVVQVSTYIFKSHVERLLSDLNSIVESDGCLPV